jgi:hypothetical protein
MAVFDFCPNSHVAEELPPEEGKVVTMNGWDFTARPGIPYRAKFKLTLGGLRWYLSGGALDITTNPTLNAGKLRAFFVEHRTWKTFTYAHEYLGTITCRFSDSVTIPKAIPNSGGLISEFEVTLIHHNPGY